MRIIGVCLIMGTLFIAGCTTSKCSLAIQPIKVLNFIDTSVYKDKEQVDKFDYYLVAGYKDNAACRQYLDSFVERNKDAERGKYGNYAMVFFKKSKKTTIENITHNKKVIDRYSNQHDLLYSYKWVYGESLARFKYKNGKIIEPQSDINVKDVKDDIPRL